jgi:hypothetical protein
MLRRERRLQLPVDTLLDFHDPLRTVETASWWSICAWWSSRQAMLDVARFLIE